VRWLKLLWASHKLKKAWNQEVNDVNVKMVVWKGVKSFLITTAGGLGGVVIELALRALVTYFADPEHVAGALSGFPPGIGVALAPVLTGLMRSLENYLKHRGPVASP
jgi:cyanate permease